MLQILFLSHLQYLETFGFEYCETLQMPPITDKLLFTITLRVIRMPLAIVTPVVRMTLLPALICTLLVLTIIEIVGVLLLSPAALTCSLATSLTAIVLFGITTRYKSLTTMRTTSRLFFHRDDSRSKIVMVV